ncbi:MAG: substrate-binding domain-containing protein [Lentisphaeria bacterium]|nr:substrate-binding domain-containing protein [Lentisphaeria bacterium]
MASPTCPITHFSGGTPEDIRLVSSERHRISRYCIPSRTAISQDCAKIAESVVQQLERMNDDDLSSAEVVLPYSLIVRDSS